MLLDQDHTGLMQTKTHPRQLGIPLSRWGRNLIACCPVELIFYFRRVERGYPGVLCAWSLNGPTSWAQRLLAWTGNTGQGCKKRQEPCRLLEPCVLGTGGDRKGPALPSRGDAPGEPGGFRGGGQSHTRGKPFQLRR